MAYESTTARIYDLYFPPDRSPEAEFWARLVGPEAELLEPMIGTAEVASILAQQGYRVTGVDLSASMLAEARRRLDGLDPAAAGRITLIEGDICAADLPEAGFDLAYVGNGSWHLLTGRELRQAALRSLFRALRPGGMLALQLFVPIRSSGRSQPRTFAPLRPAPDGWSVSKSSWMERDHLNQTMQISEEVSVNGERFSHQLLLQLLTPEELTAELAGAGFTRIALYGDSDLSPYTPDSERLVVTAVR